VAANTAAGIVDFFPGAQLASRVWRNRIGHSVALCFPEYAYTELRVDWISGDLGGVDA